MCWGWVRDCTDSDGHQHHSGWGCQSWRQDDCRCWCCTWRCFEKPTKCHPWMCDAFLDWFMCHPKDLKCTLKLQKILMELNTTKLSPKVQKLKIKMFQWLWVIGLMHWCFPLENVVYQSGWLAANFSTCLSELVFLYLYIPSIFLHL